MVFFWLTPEAEGAGEGRALPLASQVKKSYVRCQGRLVVICDGHPVSVGRWSVETPDINEFVSCVVSSPGPGHYFWTVAACARDSGSLFGCYRAWHSFAGDPYGLSLHNPWFRARRSPMALTQGPPRVRRGEYLVSAVRLFDTPRRHSRLSTLPSPGCVLVDSLPILKSREFVVGLIYLSSNRVLVTLCFSDWDPMIRVL